MLILFYYLPVDKIFSRWEEIHKEYKKWWEEKMVKIALKLRRDM
jgi:hypothetical protein